jgi:hypothetical protein
MDARPEAVEPLSMRNAIYRCAAGHETYVNGRRPENLVSAWTCGTCGEPAAWHSGVEPHRVVCAGCEQTVDELTTFQAEAGGRYCYPCADPLLQDGYGLTRSGDSLSLVDLTDQTDQSERTR